MSVQCSSGRCSGDPINLICGVCNDVALSGGSCSESVRCPRDETCSNGKCEPRVLYTPVEPSIVVPPGEVCKASSDANYFGCLLGSACFAKSPGEEARCNYLPGPGESCAQGMCWGEGRCERQVCAPVYTCPSSAPSCDKGETCVCNSADCSSRSCHLLRQEGQSCTLPAVPCADRLECVGGTCKPASIPSRYEAACK